MKIGCIPFISGWSQSSRGRFATFAMAMLALLPLAAPAAVRLEGPRIAPKFVSPQLANPFLVSRGTIKTVNGHLLTAVYGGGQGGPVGSTALNTNATVVGPWETFTVEYFGYGRFALKTISGNYVTAVNGGGLGDPPGGTSAIHTNATVAGPWEQFTINFYSNGTASIQTPTGNFVTAVGGGGYGANNLAPIHTNATAVGPWEIFRM